MTSSQHALKSADSRTNLMESAIELIWQSNYASVGINEICAHAGVTKGCFYHHFDSKVTLFSEAAQYYWEMMKQDLDRLLSPDLTAIQQLHGLLSFLVEKRRDEVEERARMSCCPFFTSGAQAGSENDRLREVGREMSEKVIRYCTVLVRNLQADGCLREPQEAAWLGRLLHEFIHGLMMYSRLHQEIDILEKDLYEGVYRLLGVLPELRQKISSSQ